MLEICYGLCVKLPCSLNAINSCISFQAFATATAHKARFTPCRDILPDFARPDTKRIILRSRIASHVYTQVGMQHFGRFLFWSRRRCDGSSLRAGRDSVVAQLRIQKFCNSGEGAPDNVSVPSSFTANARSERCMRGKTATRWEIFLIIQKRAAAPSPPPSLNPPPLSQVGGADSA